MESCFHLAELSGAEFLKAFSRKARDHGVPLGASIELTERCNLRCLHCYLGDQQTIHASKKLELSTGQWKAVLDQMAKLGVLKLLFTGGEPLLRSDFADLYRHARERGFLVTVFTNGTLISDSIVELFRELPPYLVEISLYGATAKTFEKITGIPGSFARCMAGIERLKQAGIDLGIKTVVMQQNQRELRDIAILGTSHGRRDFRFDIEIQAAFNGEARHVGTRLTPEAAVNLELTQPTRYEAIRRLLDPPDQEHIEVNDKLYQCGAGVVAIHVSAHGRLQPCLMLRHIDYNLMEGDLVRGLDSIRDQLAGIKAPPDYGCHDCEDRLICNCCPAFAMVETGSEERIPEFQCHVTRLRRDLVEKMEGIGNGE